MKDKNQYLWIKFSSLSLSDAITVSREELDILKQLSSNKENIIIINLNN
jgi:hypothetical protein